MSKFIFEAVRYRFEKINGEPKIILDQVKVSDEKGKYIKFAKLEKLINVISGESIKFK